MAKNLGIVTAYGYAVQGGYTGTEAQFMELLANARGIVSIVNTSTSGAVHTYTITYTDGTTQTYNVTDGEVTEARLQEVVGDLKTDFNNTAELINNKNLANPYDPNYVMGKRVNADGTYTETSLFNTTGFIPVKGGEKIVGSFTENGARADAYLRFMCCYDATKTPIPSKYVNSEAKTHTVPSDVAFVRISIGAYYWNELMLEFGTTRSAYIVPNNIFTPIRIADECVSAEKLKDYKVVDGYNLTPIGESGVGFWYASGGELVLNPNAGYNYVIVPIDGGNKYTFNRNVQFTVTTDNTGAVVDYSGNYSHQSYDVGLTAKTMYVSYPISSDTSKPAICKGNEATTVTKYTTEWLGIDTPNRSIKGISIDNRAYCSIPKIIYMNTSEAIKIYLEDILSQKGSYFWCNSVSGLTTFINDEYLQITCDTVGEYSLKWAVYDSNMQLLDSGTSTVKVSALSSLANKKTLILGDSFVAYGGIGEALLNEYTENEKILTLIGTRGTSPNFNEGRGGWSAETYCLVASAGDYINPFFHNNTFDFSYYMSQNGYSGLDYVFINLGINKIFGLELTNYESNVALELEYYKTIIDSIHDYDPNIKIFCNLPTPPNTIDGKFSESYGTTQMLWVYANQIKRYAHDMIENIGGTNVYIVGTNYVFDTDTDIWDGVHPTSAGYSILAKAMVNAVIGS